MGRRRLRSVALLLFLVHLGGVPVARGDEDLDAECHSLGFNPHPEDCWRFLVCTEDAEGNLKAHQHSCPLNQVYSHSDQGCVPEDQVKACKRDPRESDPECKGTTMSCMDCHSLVICENDGKEFHKIFIENCTAGKFCDPRKLECTSVQPPECIPHGGCTSEGIFPSIKNCSIYYECKGSGNKRTLQETAHICDRGYVFTPTPINPPTAPSGDENCKHRDTPETCITVQCTGAVEKKPYTTNPDSQYYVLCTAEKTGFVFKCADGIYDHDLKDCKATSKKNLG